MSSVPSNPASLPMHAHIAGDRIMATSHALSLLPQMSKLQHGVQPIFVNTAEHLCHAVEEAVPLTAGTVIKKTPSNLSGSLSQDNASMLSLAKTPINIHNLKQEFVVYDPRKGSEILNGFIYGFPLHYTGARMPTDAMNFKSARTRPEIVGQKINAEIEAGRVAGPFDEHPLLNLCVSPLGLVPKKK